MTGVCAREQRKRLGYKDPYRGTGHVMIEAETGVKLPQAKEQPEPPEARRDDRPSSLHWQEDSLLLSHLGSSYDPTPMQFHSKVEPPKADGSQWRVLTKRGPLEKTMADHFSIFALRTP